MPFPSPPAVACIALLAYASGGLIAAETTPDLPASGRYEVVIEVPKPGERGTTEGVVLGWDEKQGSLVLRTDQGSQLFVAKRSGGPDGPPDKAMVERIIALRIGQRASVTWFWEERRKIEDIDPAPAKTKAKAKR